MSHKQTPYSPNFPVSQGYGPPAERSKNDESYPMNPQAGYPHSMPMPASAPVLPPGAQPLPGMQHGFQPGFQPGFQTGYQPAYQPGYAPGYPPVQQGYLPPVMQQPVPGLLFLLATSSGFTFLA